MKKEFTLHLEKIRDSWNDEVLAYKVKDMDLYLVKDFYDGNYYRWLISSKETGYDKHSDDYMNDGVYFVNSFKRGKEALEDIIERTEIEAEEDAVGEADSNLETLRDESGNVTGFKVKTHDIYIMKHYYYKAIPHYFWVISDDGGNYEENIDEVYADIIQADTIDEIIDKAMGLMVEQDHEQAIVRGNMRITNLLRDVNYYVGKVSRVLKGLDIMAAIRGGAVNVVIYRGDSVDSIDFNPRPEGYEPRDILGAIFEKAYYMIEMEG